MELVELLLSDEGLAVVVPIVVYWAYCGLHAMLGQSRHLAKYRLHPSSHEDSKNHVSKRQVISNVLTLQLVQVVMVTMVMMFKVRVCACVVRACLLQLNFTSKVVFLENSSQHLMKLL
jgi:sphinganine C4-monooxygenase